MRKVRATKTALQPPARARHLKQRGETGELRGRIEHDYREPKDASGLYHFEGLDLPRLHHHYSVSIADLLPLPRSGNLGALKPG